nr:lipid II flippase MurJ [Paenibacillus phyllosphaerae]
MSFAAYFGTSSAADVVNTAYLLPETLGYNLIAAVIAVATVPSFTRLWTGGNVEGFRTMVKRLALHTALAMAAIGCVLLLLRPVIAPLFGYSPADPALPVFKPLYALLLITLPLFPLYATFAGALQASGAFYAAAIGPLLLNAFMLVAVIASLAFGLAPASGAYVFAGSIAAGTAAMAALTAIAIRRKLAPSRSGNMRTNSSKLAAAVLSLEAGGLPVQGAMSPAVWQESTDEGRPERAAHSGRAEWEARAATPGRKAAESARDESMRGIYRLFVPFFLLTLCTQVVYALERVMASQLHTGTITALTYAYRIAQFPNWVFVAAVTAVLLPSLSRVSHTREERRQQILRAIKGTLMLLLPVALVLFLCRRPIIALLLGRGAFDAAAVEQTAELLAGYALSVPGLAISAIGVRYYLAVGRVYKPAAIYALAAGGNLLFDYLLLDQLGASALGYGACAGWTLNAVLMIWLISRESDSTRREPAC